MDQTKQQTAYARRMRTSSTFFSTGNQNVRKAPSDSVSRRRLGTSSPSAQHNATDAPSTHEPAHRVTGSSGQTQNPDSGDSQKQVKRSKSRYVPALDGLRSFAVIAVIIYHMGLGWAPGGLMGVTVFFVISGYLINGLLVAERENTGTISLKGFWLRRIRRLFPAIFLAVVGTAALCTLFNHTLLDKMRPDVIPSLLFYNNWWQIFRDISYFEAAGSPSPLTHFWSLSIEEQFYVVWPLLLLLMYRLGAGKRTMSRIVLALALFSAVEMALMYSPAGDPSRIYYGTDTRAMSLLVGVWLAFAWPSAAFGGEPEVSSRDRATWIGFNVIGIIALLGLIAIIVFTNGYSSFPYYGGIAITTLLSAALIAVLAVPDTWVARFFALPPLVWIGKRSYGMYLWHFPILLLTTDPNSTTGVPWWMRIVQIGLIVGVSALSYTFIEDPIRKGRIGQWWHRRHGSQPDARKDDANTKGAGALSEPDSLDRRKPNPLRSVIPAGCFVALIAIAAFGMFAVKPTDYASLYAGTASTQGQAPEAESQTARQGEESVEGGETSNEAETDANTGEQVTSPSGDSAYDEIFMTQQYGADGQEVFTPLLIGDSVAAGAEEAFYELFPYGHIDAEVNRNIWESPYPAYRDAGQVGDYVVICLGTNNAVVDWQIDDELLNSVEEDKHVFMVNTRNTREWLDSTNAEIARTPERHPNVTVIDWYNASAGHDEYFVGDGTHLNDVGAHAYMQLIQDAIKASLES